MATLGKGLLRSDDLGARWTGEPGLPASARLYSLCAAPGELLVGGDGRVYRYSERAWSELALPAPDAQVWALAAMDGVILAGTRPLGLFRSDDGGRRWEPMTFDLPEVGEPQPEARRADTGVPRAERGEPQPEARRADMGVPRAERGEPQPAVRGAAEGEPSDAEWEARSAPRRLTALLPNPWVPGEVWAGVEAGGVFASVDGGGTWSAANEQLPSLDIHGLAWSSGGMLLAATPCGVASWRSARWMEGVFHSADRYCRALAPRPDDPSTLYCGFCDGLPGTRGGIAVSADGGRSWRPSGGVPGGDSTIWSVATAPDAAGLVLACSISGTVLVSLDACASAMPVLAAGCETPAVACLSE